MTFESSPYSQPACHLTAHTPDRSVLRRLHTIEVSMDEVNIDMDEAAQRVVDRSMETLRGEKSFTKPLRGDVCVFEERGDECVDSRPEGDRGLHHDYSVITEEGEIRTAFELLARERRQCPGESAGSPLAVNALEDEGEGGSSIRHGHDADAYAVFAPSGFSTGFSSGKSYVPTANIYDMGVTPFTDEVELQATKKSREQVHNDASINLRDDEGGHDTAATDEVASPVEQLSLGKEVSESSPAVTSITKPVYDGFSSGKTFVPTADIYEMGIAVLPGDDLEVEKVEPKVPRENLLDNGPTSHDEPGRNWQSQASQGRDADLAEDEDNGWCITSRKPSGFGGFGTASSFVPTADIYELGIVVRPEENDIEVASTSPGVRSPTLTGSEDKAHAIPAQESQGTGEVLRCSQTVGDSMVQEEVEEEGIKGRSGNDSPSSVQQAKTKKTVQVQGETQDLLAPARRKLAAFKFGANSHVANPQQPGKVEASVVPQGQPLRDDEEKASIGLEEKRDIQQDCPDSDRGSDSCESRKRRQYDHGHDEVAKSASREGKKTRRAEKGTSAEATSTISISGQTVARTCMPPPNTTHAHQQRPSLLSPPPSETFTAPSAPRIIKPFTRTSYPDPIAPPSTILNLGSESLLRTCFRVGEVLRCGRSKDEERVMIIEFFGVLHSSTCSERTSYQPRPEYVLQLSDVFHPSRGPYLSGRCWHDVSNDVRVGDIIRVVGVPRVAKDGKMELKMEKVRKATWSEIEYVRGIVN
ncbi:hypothetical protein YB2330_002355 [Saitoella coloradoensis]